MAVAVEVPVAPLVQPEPIVEQYSGYVTPVAVSTEAEAKAFIYLKESTNRLDAENSGGCKGLGQDCNGQLVIDCPDWRTNYSCQDAYWERYMKSRYGSWTSAKSHWIARVPINGKDVGNWW